MTKYLHFSKFQKCNNYKYIKHNLTLRSCECFINSSQQYGRSPVCTLLCTFRQYVLLNVLLHPSQRYGRSPVCTCWCTFRFYVLLNVLLCTLRICTFHSTYPTLKKRGNITVLKRGKNIMKCELQISYTNIMWCGRKVLRLIFFLPWILFFFQIKVIPFKTVPLGS